MNDKRIIRCLGVKKQGEMYIWSYEENARADKRFRVDTLYTALSAGTELTFIKGTNPYLHSRWDSNSGLFVRGETGVQYPVPFLRYMEVGRVSESRTVEVEAGELVARLMVIKQGIPLIR